MGSMDLRRAGENDAQASGVGICVDGGAMLQGRENKKNEHPWSFQPPRFRLANPAGTTGPAPGGRGSQGQLE